MTQQSMNFNQFDAEAGLASRLKQHGVSIFNGPTDPNIRRERFRAAIADNGLDYVIASIGGKNETYAQLFERIYNEPFDPKQRKVKKHAQATV